MRDMIVAGGGCYVCLRGVGADSIRGSRGSDYLVGCNGSDSLTGGANADFMLPGTGIDGFYFDDGVRSDDLDQMGDVQDGVDIAYRAIGTSYSVTNTNLGALLAVA